MRKWGGEVTAQRKKLEKRQKAYAQERTLFL
jgi:hypothetical protein